VIQTRAIAVPKVRITGDYDQKQRSDVDIISTNGFNLGSDQNWQAQIRVVQSLYEGGRIASSLRVAKLTREQAMLNYQTAVSDTVLDVQIGYFDVLLAEQQIIVQEASVELLSRELADTNRRFDAGTVPRFNVLRAEVELANAQPKLIRARNAFRIAKNNLANLVGFNVPKETFEDIPLKLSGKLEAVPYEMEFPRAIAERGVIPDGDLVARPLQVDRRRHRSLRDRRAAPHGEAGVPDREVGGRVHQDVALGDGERQDVRRRLRK